MRRSMAAAAMVEAVEDAAWWWEEHRDVGNDERFEPRALGLKSTFLDGETFERHTPLLAVYRPLPAL